MLKEFKIVLVSALTFMFLIGIAFDHYVMPFVPAILISSGPERDIADGWYSQADKGFTIGIYGIRCLCAAGFKGRDIDDKTFEVTQAPRGYDDTIGRRFKMKAIEDCWNCAD